MMKHPAFYRLLLFIGIAAMIFPLSSCQKEDLKPTITVLMGKNGKGDNDYSALIYKAIEKWQNHPEINMKIFYPQTPEEATQLYREWAESSAGDVRSLMVPANGQFADMVENEKLDLKPNQQVLAFELDLKKPIEGVHAFELSHSGVSYLAGKMASLCKEAVVLIGHNTPMLKHAASCFRSGFGADRSYECIEISPYFNGFNMPEKAKELASRHKDAFILPLAGLSNNGVFDFLNECQESDLVMAAGMDVDCNSLSHRIPFSYLVNIDKAIDLHLQYWYDGKPWPESVLGLAEGMTSILINPDFTEVAGITRADFERLYEENIDEAIRRDKK